MPVEVPSFDELMWPALQALKAMGGSATNEELLQKVIELGGYPPEVQNFVHTDNRQTKVNYNLAWAKTYLKLVGAVNNSQRGVWSITEKGETLTQADVAAIPAQVRRKFPARKKLTYRRRSRPMLSRSTRTGKRNSSMCLPPCRLMLSNVYHSGFFEKVASSRYR